MRLLCSSATIHLLLTDVILPGMKGPELARWARGERPALQVVYMSGYTGQSLGEGVLDPDIELVQKPFTPRSLARKVRDVLDAVSDRNPK